MGWGEGWVVAWPLTPCPSPCRKQCIELEQQFDFLKDLVASVPDMQGDAEDNHMEGERVSRRWGSVQGRASRECWVVRGWSQVWGGRASGRGWAAGVEPALEGQGQKGVLGVRGGASGGGANEEGVL